MKWWQHAFAMPARTAFQPTAEERALIDHLGHELGRRQMRLPATVMLESARPLGFVAAQAIWFSYPWFSALTNAAGLKLLGQILERPGGMDWILDRWNELDEQSPSSCPANTAGER